MKYDITILGNAPVDVLYPNTDEEFLAEFGLTKAVFNSVSDDEFKRMHNRLGEGPLASGGSGANTGYTLAKLRHKVAFVGYVGNDRLGHHFYNDMTDAGITLPAPTEGEVTMRIHAMITPDGERTFASNGAGKAFKAEEIPEDTIAGSRMVLVEAYLLREEHHHNAIFHALRLARGNDIPLALTLASSSLVKERFSQVHRIITEGLDLLVGNDEEFAALEEAAQTLSPPDHAAFKTTLANTHRLHTHGPNGASFFAPSRRGGVVHLHEPCLPAENIVSANGAGDNFLAGFLDGLLRKDPYRTALRQGHKLANRVLGQVEARLPNPGRHLFETARTPEPAR